MFHTAVLLAAALAGLGIGSIVGPADTDLLVEFFLGAMLYFVFVCIDVGKLKDSFSDRRFLLMTLGINFIWTPFLVLCLGHLFFDGDQDIRTGFFLALIAPCTDWYLVFTASAKGSVSKAEAVLPLNLLLQIILIPFFLVFLFGSEIETDSVVPIVSTLLVLLVPLSAAAAARKISKKVFEVSLSYASDGQLVCLALAVFLMFLSSADYFIDNSSVFLECILPFLAFFLINYAAVLLVSKHLDMDYPTSTAAVFTCIARNSPLVLAIITPLFSDSPSVLAAVAILPLLELPLLSMICAYRRKRSEHNQ